MISKYFLEDNSFRLLSRIMGVEYPTLIADMTILLKSISSKGEVILEGSKGGKVGDENF